MTCIWLTVQTPVLIEEMTLQEPGDLRPLHLRILSTVRPLIVTSLLYVQYSSPSILQPCILSPPLIIRPLDLVPKGNFLC